MVCIRFSFFDVGSFEGDYADNIDITISILIPSTLINVLGVF